MVKALLIVLLSVATSLANDFVPNDHPTLNVPVLQGTITIDGEIDDSGWKQAARAHNFSEVDPNDNTKPDEETEVFVTYDRENLYLLFICHDDPSTLRATISDRDNIWQDDYLGIILDTYGDRAWAYELFVNPFGIQGDLRWTSHGEDMSFDIVWYSVGKVTDSGWQVEVSVPFQSLRFPNREEQNWTATFWRNRPRESRYRYSWAATDRDNPCWICNFGTLTGIRDVKPAGKLEVLPSAIAFQSGSIIDSDNPDAGFDNEPLDAEVSLNAKYSISSDLVAEGTINPDFSQVESDASQVDVNSTFALWYPERRPFFQEGSDLFNTWIDVVYTRSINDPQFAGKLYGRLDRTSVAFIGAQDENSVALLPGAERSYLAQMSKSFVSIARLKQTVLDDSYVGLTVTDRRWNGGGSGSAFSTDARLRFLNNWIFQMQAISSYTREPDDGLDILDDNDQPVTFDSGDRTFSFDSEKYWGHAAAVSLARVARVWSIDLDYQEFSPSFRLDNGFETRNSNRMASLWTNLDFRLNDNPIVDRVQSSIQVGRLWDWDGSFKDEWVRPYTHARFKGQTSAELSFLFSREKFQDTLITGIRRLNIWTESRFSKPVTIGFWFNTGHSLIRFLESPALGQTWDAEIWSRIKLTQRLTVRPSARFFRADFLENTDPAFFTDPVITPGQNIVENWILRTRFNYQLSRHLNARLIVDYYDEDNTYDPDRSDRRLSLEPLVTYELNPFTIFYIGSTHDYRDFEYSGPTYIRRHPQQFFAKLQYLFRP
jgi:hypothetical protein